MGGTMTESSNYDPAPRAYGIWRETGQNEYEAKYKFYLTKALPRAPGGSNSDGWLPAGRGVLTMDKPSEGVGVATGEGVRLVFGEWVARALANVWALE
jgi:hypothetical protein